MSNRAQLAAAMPAMLLHEGDWEGWYRHFDGDGALLDAHRVKTWCEFPDHGEWHYIQHNELIWDDGRTAFYEFGGRLEGQQLVWRTDRFAGYGWQTREDVLMLRLERQDVADAYYIEMIAISADRLSRSRTWEWFQGGRPWKWTLCNERKIAPTGPEGA
ncbi:hypothetical protein [Novosphingobium sp. Gsoil 351]|uniref:hypothetical protein n=1 Tax=Novosphingobium sp. Gsoil 351 TaxID=2675225 RepID=UPI001E392FE1|nr:hypothetical protein [Novosphingobium sp. Gsoil 351]